MAKGTIIKALSGFYYVKNEQGLFQCRARGNFRKRKIKPLVGDRVEFEAENRTDGYILAVDQRKNEIARPPISNVDQAILVFSAVDPVFNPLLLNRFLVHIEAHQIDPIICISKADLVDETLTVMMEDYQNDYQRIGYDVVITSSMTNEGLEQLWPYIADNVSVIAGQSGVGKSSLLNALRPGLNIETNAISKHLGRGKHTTRHVELIPFGEGFVADTPGFSALDFDTIEAEELSAYFPEMRARLANCKFRECTHVSEPKCAIKEAVEQGDILDYRYEHYLEFLTEIKNRKRRY